MHIQLGWRGGKAEGARFGGVPSARSGELGSYAGLPRPEQGAGRRDRHPSGLQYRVLQAPAKPDSRKPTWASTVQVRYRGTLIDGTVFDETKPTDAPAAFEAGGVIKGWQEALTLMHEGEKWQVVIPSELAYGCKGKGDRVKSDQVLVFDIELLKIK